MDCGLFFCAETVMAMLPEGRYMGRITGHDLEALGERESPAVTIQFVVNAGTQKTESGKYDGASIDAKGAARQSAYFLEGEGVERLLKVINKLGWDPESLELFGSEHYEESPLKDKEVEIVVKYYKDRESFYINPPYTPKSPEKRSEEKKSILDRLGGSFKAYKAAKKLQEQAQAIDGDETPF